MKKEIIVGVTMHPSHPKFDALFCQENLDSAKANGVELIFPDTLPTTNSEWQSFLSPFKYILSTWGAPCFNAELLNACPKLKLVTHAGGSIADLVTPDFYEQGLKICSANEVMAEGVARWCLGMVVACGSNWQKVGTWAGNKPLNFDLAHEAKDVGSKTIGIWGLGTISKKLIPLLHCLDPEKIIVHSSYLTPKEEEIMGIEYRGFDELFEEADILLPLASLNEKNLERVQEKHLENMKLGACLINAGRARLIQKDALYKVLHSGRINAALDVFYEEPLPLNDPLQQLSNVILTPHVGAANLHQYVPKMIQEIIRFSTKQSLKYEISIHQANTMTSHQLAKV
ncbi:MAG: hypothetical protein MK193_13385 [Lentisphaeria bacterium]|nr:hypothetical protein [Lentisphaeria bacterium]